MTQRQAGREYPTFSRKKANWIGYILRRNCILKHVIEGNKEGRMEATGRQGRRRKQLVDDLTVKRRYWKLKAEALRSHVVEICFGRGYGPIIGQLQNEEIWKGPGFKLQDLSF
jgi:hypothetical protein